MEAWIVSTTVNVKKAQFFFAASTRCRSSLPCPTRPAWLNVQRKRWHFYWCGKNEILEINKIKNNPIPPPGVHPHRWSGAVCLRLALPRLPRLWQGERRFHPFLGNWKYILFSIHLVKINSFADLQARPGQQCVHLPWCQLGGHCCRSRYFAYSADLTWVEFQILTLLITFHPQGSITFRTEFSSLRRKLWQIWCPKKILQSAGKKKTRQYLVGPRSVGFNPTFCGQYHSDVTTEIFFRLYPPLSNIQEISVQIAKKVYILSLVLIVMIWNKSESNI